MTSLNIENLHPEVTKVGLLRILLDAGRITFIKVFTDEQNKCLGHAYVTFLREEDAEFALNYFCAKKIYGEAMKLTWAEDDSALCQSEPRVHEKQFTAEKTEEAETGATVYDVYTEADYAPVFNWADEEPVNEDVEIPDWGKRPEDEKPFIPDVALSTITEEPVFDVYMEADYAPVLNCADEEPGIEDVPISGDEKPPIPDVATLPIAEEPATDDVPQKEEVEQEAERPESSPQCEEMTVADPATKPAIDGEQQKTELHTMEKAVTNDVTLEKDLYVEDPPELHTLEKTGTDAVTTENNLPLEDPLIDSYVQQGTKKSKLRSALRRFGSACRRILSRIAHAIREGYEAVRGFLRRTTL